ncbi:hypothetical protein XELAEV_18036671mg [Xenopus laevis]|uniref:Uncharacterized protein n=1 Tax=Xenopus laevis TaxID=8355 RepID=A0A974CB95_XENLA|nr:hypothetical protein XELAEV_18036671mg [Xenopus laevis]
MFGEITLGISDTFLAQTLGLCTSRLATLLPIGLFFTYIEVVLAAGSHRLIVSPLPNETILTRYAHQRQGSILG